MIITFTGKFRNVSFLILRRSAVGGMTVLALFDLFKLNYALAI